MSVEFDPAWEYFVPCEEIEEIFRDAAESATGFDRITDTSDDFNGRQVTSGLRFGRGNPDCGAFHLARTKREREEKNGRLGIRCRGCTSLYFPEQEGRRYCGLRCYRDRDAPERERKRAAKAERRAALQGMRAVAAREMAFRREAAAEDFWQRKQERRAAFLRDRLAKREDILRRFVDLWRSGVTVADMCDRLGVHHATVSRWVLACGERQRNVKTESRPAPCKACGTMFTEQRSRKQIYCSPACVPKPGRRRAGPDQWAAECPGCGREYVRKRTDRAKYCTPACGTAAKAANFKRAFAAAKATRASPATEGQP